VRAEDPLETRAATISAHVVDVVLRRTCRDSLLSLTGFGKRGLFSQKAKAVQNALLFLTPGLTSARVTDAMAALVVAKENPRADP
jgi:hypothetical protein